jgi:DNA polymerase-3 subunit delta
MEPEAVYLLSAHIGADLVKLHKALDRLALMCKGKVSKADISEHIGISKDFNIFELQKAIGQKQDAKALYIANYFANNEKEHHIIPVTSALYRYFAKIVRYHRSTNHGDQKKLAAELGVHPFFIREFKEAAQHYPTSKLLQAMEVLHDIDLKSKGVGNSQAKHAELMRELVARLIRL